MGDNVEYFYKGFWQPCQLIDFHNVEHVGSIYSIEFKGSLFSVFESEIRFLNFASEQLTFPLSSKKNLDSEVIFH